MLALAAAAYALAPSAATAARRPIPAAKAFRLPSAARCVSGRTLTIRLLSVPGVRWRQATVKVDGKRVKTIPSRQVGKPIRLARLPRRTFVLARITRGEYKAGDRLPSEQELMSAYGVGRNTVREAMHSLRTLGLVEIRPRLGAKVLDAGARNAFANSAASALLRGETVKELYDVRLILEPAAAAKAAVNRTEDDIIAIRRARTHFHLAYEMESPVWEADIEFHHAIAVASGNSVLTRILAPMSELLRNARRATGTLPAAVELALHQHDEIAIAIEEGSSKRARRAMTAHMKSAIWAIEQVGDLDEGSAAGRAAVSAHS